jgi:carboxynorspermidine decarboxylase
MKNKFPNINVSDIKTPCFIIDQAVLEKDAMVLSDVQKKAGCKIIVALKGFAMWNTFHILKKHLAGACAGSLYEARLGREEFGKEVQTYSPAFKDSEFDEILSYSDKIIFNSLDQFEKFKEKVIKNKKEIGLRINPEKSVAGALFGVYDPCNKNSRLGIRLKDLQGKDLDGVTGLHFHALCEQGSEELEIVLKSFEEKFGFYIKKMKWVNFGGGHHITAKDYNVKLLVKLIKNFRKKYPNIKEVYLEPGEAVALNAGIMVASVLDIVKNKNNIAILDTSVETHFPDVLITRNEASPYMQKILGAEPAMHNNDLKNKYNYTIAGTSCAAGDVFGEYVFAKELKIGDKLIFCDCAHYTMVKTSTFCGVPLPAINLRDKKGDILTVKNFKYGDYKSRLS